jgi:hypothetical protein
LTFEESELQTLVDEIIGLLEKYRDDPGSLDVILSELKSLYRKVPIYPGIIANCLSMVVKSIEPKQLKIGDEVSLLTKDNRILTGKISSVTQGEIKIIDCYEYGGQKSSDECNIPLANLKEARLFTREILRKEWPDLDFEE